MSRLLQIMNVEKEYHFSGTNVTLSGVEGRRTPMMDGRHILEVSLTIVNPDSTGHHVAIHIGALQNGAEFTTQIAAASEAPHTIHPALGRDHLSQVTIPGISLDGTLFQPLNPIKVEIRDPESQVANTVFGRRAFASTTSNRMRDEFKLFNDLLKRRVYGARSFIDWCFYKWDRPAAKLLERSNLLTWGLKTVLYPAGIIMRIARKAQHKLMKQNARSSLTL